MLAMSSVSFPGTCEEPMLVCGYSLGVPGSLNDNELVPGLGICFTSYLKVIVFGIQASCVGPSGSDTKRIEMYIGPNQYLIFRVETSKSSKSIYTHRKLKLIEAKTLLSFASPCKLSDIGLDTHPATLDTK
jgi:hypothetical protein